MGSGQAKCVFFPTVLYRFFSFSLSCPPHSPFFPTKTRRTFYPVLCRWAEGSPKPSGWSGEAAEESGHGSLIPEILERTLGLVCFLQLLVMLRPGQRLCRMVFMWIKWISYWGHEFQFLHPRICFFYLLLSEQWSLVVLGSVIKLYNIRSVTQPRLQHIIASIQRAALQMLSLWLWLYITLKDVIYQVNVAISSLSMLQTK